MSRRKLPVQADPECVKLDVSGLQAGPGNGQRELVAKVEIQILRLERPTRRERPFSAAADRISEIEAARRGVTIQRAGKSRNDQIVGQARMAAVEARLDMRPGESARRIKQPIAAGITQAATQ